MSRITDMPGDVQAESCEWLFKSPLAWDRGHIVAAALQASQLVHCMQARDLFQLHSALVIKLRGTFYRFHAPFLGQRFCDKC